MWSPLTSCAAIDNYCILICLCFASDALMNSITSYLFDGAPESKNMLGTTRAMDAMNIISPCSAFNLFSMKALSLWRTVALTKAHTWTFTRKASPSPLPLFFLEIKNRSLRVQILLTATRRRKEIVRGRRRGS